MTPKHQNILGIIASHAQRDASMLRANDVLIDLDIDSLKFLMLVLDVEQALGKSVFSVDNVGKLRTVGDMLMLADAPH